MPSLGKRERYSANFTNFCVCQENLASSGSSISGADFWSIWFVLICRFERHRGSKARANTWFVNFVGSNSRGLDIFSNKRFVVPFFSHDVDTTPEIWWMCSVFDGRVKHCSFYFLVWIVQKIALKLICPRPRIVVGNPAIVFYSLGLESIGRLIEKSPVTIDEICDWYVVRLPLPLANFARRLRKTLANFFTETWVPKLEWMLDNHLFCVCRQTLKCLCVVESVWLYKIVAWRRRVNPLEHQRLSLRCAKCRGQSLPNSSAKLWISRPTLWEIFLGQLIHTQQALECLCWNYLKLVW